MTNKADFVETLNDTFDALQNAMPQLLAACQGTEQSALIAKRDALREVMVRAATADLKNFNAAVEKLSSQLKAETDALKGTLDGFKTVVEVIGLVAGVTKLAGDIVTAAAA
jgi:hypothetical protein